MCDRTIQFVLKNDLQHNFQFASLQSAYAKKHLSSLSTSTDAFDTVIYQRGEETLEKSSAIIAILEDLGGFWKLFGLFRLIPRRWRDWIYDLIAKHRYRWFGKYEKCTVPTDAARKRFL